MALQVPGLLTKTIAPIVAPRKTSSEMRRLAGKDIGEKSQKVRLNDTEYPRVGGLGRIECWLQKGGTAGFALSIGSRFRDAVAFGLGYKLTFALRSCGSRRIVLDPTALRTMIFSKRQHPARRMR